MAEQVALYLENEEHRAEAYEEGSQPRGRDGRWPRRRSKPLAASESDDSMLTPISSTDDLGKEPLIEGGVSARAAVQWDGSRLYWFDEAPPVLQFNKYVRSGYRAGMSPRQCLCSMFQYHNEIGNIWIHLLPLLAIVGGVASGWLPVWPGRPWEFAQNLAPIAVCYCGSVTYHTMMAHHQKYQLWITLDVCGIFVLFLGGAQVLMWWGLHCYPTLRMTVAVIYYTTAACAVLSSIQATTVLWRVLPMACLFLVRVTVTATRWHLGSGSRAATWHYIMMEVWSVVGGALNTARAPECWLPVRAGKPGLLDYWLNSHQLMHILVAVAMTHLHWGATLDYRYYASAPECT